MDLQYTNYHNNTIFSKAVTDKKYLIVTISKIDLPRAGLGWFILLMLSGVRAAIENGYIPVIDWQSYPLPFYDTGSVGAVNIWELYFEQPFNISLEAAYKSGDYYISDGIHTLPGYKQVSYADMTDPESLEGKVWRQYFQRYIRLKESVKRDFENQYCNLTGKKRPTVGVLYRGTDYKMLEPPGHGIIPDTHIVMDEVQRILVDKKAETVFLATEDEGVLQCFQRKFGAQLRVINSRRYTQPEKTILNLNDELKGDKGHSDYQYLMALYFLSLADEAVYTSCSGSVVSALMRRQGEHYILLYEGNYSPVGIIISSDYEEESKELARIYDKPLVYYPLNMMIYLGIKTVAVACTPRLKAQYFELLEDGRKWGMDICYMERMEGEDIGNTLYRNIDEISDKRLCIMKENQIFFGGNFTQKIAWACRAFDGSYAFYGYGGGQDGGMEGVYFFDRDAGRIVRHIYQDKKEVTLTDIQAEYIKEKKLIVEWFNRGTIRLNIDGKEDIKDASELIRVIQKYGGQPVGDPYITALQKKWVEGKM